MIIEYRHHIIGGTKMKEVTLLFENAKDRLDEAKNCISELTPCQARRTEDNTGFLIRKSYSTSEEYENILRIKEKFALRPYCSAFVYFDDFVGKDETYVVIHKDVFPSIVDEYDNSLTLARNKINTVLSEYFFEGKFQLYPAEEISSGITSKCPESRRYELEMWDENQERLLHGFIYQKGEVIEIIGDMDNVISIWKEK
jgi:hypothetical protein